MPVITVSSTNVPPALRGPIAISRSCLPRYWATIYCDVFKADRKPSTLRRTLGAIERLYLFGENMVPSHDLDRILTQLDIPSLKNLMAGFLSHLRTGAQGRSVSVDQTWCTGFDFVYDLVKLLGASALDAKRLHTELHDLKSLYGQLSPRPPAQPRHITAVPNSAVDDMFDILTVGGDRNVFRCEDEQVRNLLIFEMLLRLGLRRGELLALGVDALQSEFDPRLARTRFWLVVAESHIDEDPRYLRGSLKTTASWRSIPLPDDLAERMRHFIDFRRGRSNYRHLFLSNQGRPLSAPAVSLILSSASDALSQQARNALRMRGLERIRPHDLRHTAVVARLQMFKNAGISVEESVERLRPYFGWSPGSKMPLRYGRAFFETQFSEIWAESLDDHLAALREIMGGDQ